MCCNAPKAGHDFFDGFSDELLRVKFGGFTDELIAFAQREGEADAGPAFVVVQFRHGIGINRVFVNRIAAVAVANRITQRRGWKRS